MVEEGKTGTLVPPKNVAALSDAIIALLKDEAKREEMADNIRNEYFVGDKSWKVIAEKYIEFYKKILRAHYLQHMPYLLFKVFLLVE